MAQGFFNTSITNTWAESAGIKPAERIDPIAIKVMNEVDINISQKKPKILTPEMNNEFDYIITMGCIKIYHITPKGKTIEKYRDIHDMIKHHVEELIDKVII